MIKAGDSKKVCNFFLLHLLLPSTSLISEKSYALFAWILIDLNNENLVSDTEVNAKLSEKQSRQSLVLTFTESSNQSGKIPSLRILRVNAMSIPLLPYFLSPVNDIPACLHPPSTGIKDVATSACLYLSFRLI